MPPDVQDPTMTLDGIIIGAVADQVSLYGTAADNIGVDHITWANAETTGSGNCNWADPDWDVDIAVQAGDNTITITVYDAAANWCATTLVVNYTAAAGGGTTIVRKVVAFMEG